MSNPSRRRMRRLRANESMRSLVRETRLSAADLIQPLFVVEREKDAGPIESMPGVSRHTVSQLGDVAGAIAGSGIPAILLFGVPAAKDANGTSAADPEGIVPQAIRACRSAAKDIVIITDVCMCSYTDHGHCGIIRDDRVDNDPTIARLGEIAVSHAQSGADWVAPSAMMDGMVAAIRSALDESKCNATGILSYAVKYASSFYGPFRDAADCAPQFSDRRTYQMDPANAREALAESRIDLDEGADILMVKPAMAYLDVIHRVKSAHPDVPLAAYQVSGEYSMIQAAVQRDWMDEKRAVLESLTAIKRAGADMIITYWASKVAGWLRES